MTVLNTGVSENVPLGSTAGSRATKKPPDVASEGFGIKCTAAQAPYTQTLVASGNPAAMEISLGRKLCVPAFQSGMPFKPPFYWRMQGDAKKSVCESGN